MTIWPFVRRVSHRAALFEVRMLRDHVAELEMQVRGLKANLTAGEDRLMATLDDLRRLREESRGLRGCIESIRMAATGVEIADLRRHCDVLMKIYWASWASCLMPPADETSADPTVNIYLPMGLARCPTPAASPTT